MRLPLSCFSHNDYNMQAWRRQAQPLLYTHDVHLVYSLPITQKLCRHPTRRVGPGMAEASAATTIHVVPVVLYSSGGACLRHARPNHICRPLYVSSSAVSLPKQLHTF